MNTTTAPPERFIVVDSNVYWLDTPAPIVQSNGRTVHWLPPVILMHAPVTVTGQIAWQDSEIVEACEPAQVDAIVAALTETYNGLDAAHQVA